MSSSSSREQDGTLAGTSCELMVTPRRLSAAGFSPFGEVIEPVGTAVRHMVTSAFETDGLPSERLLWVYQLPAPACLPLKVTTMERHPHSAQFFSPLSCSEFLVAVCLSGENGEPDIGKLAAFIARSGQGIVYRPNVWHHPMVALDGPAVFVVSLAKGCADDSVSVTIGSPVTIVSMPQEMS
ncbi:ureidoglycolate lyase [Bradyrhizobium sp. UNPF46]|uniref:ureidoglycolate lyase n=1 Tax=Bradyrhizobium sp. UNPF46 TaxID=1141168 RepID=UPI00115116CE|nr:ureidoglycolate lyase [Bradyrhizobium sp. UNPF46]